MPVILDDAMLIPPSMRRKHYNLDRDRIIELDSSSSTIEIPRSPPQSMHRPVVIHEEYRPVERPATEIITEREIIIDPGTSGVRRYRGPEYRRGRAQSLSGYDSFSETSSVYDDSEYYYLEDGTRHRHPRRAVGEGFAAGLATRGIPRDRHRRYHDTRPRQSGDPHKLRHLAEGAVIGGAVEHLRHRRRSSSTSSTSSDDSHHHLRNLAGAGIAAAGAKALYDRHRTREYEREGRTVIVEDPDRHRHMHRLAEAGVGLAAGAAAKGLYDRHRRHRSRSLSSSRSRSRSRVGRHLAATALGATAAGVAAHKLNHRRRGSWSSYSSDDDDHHRGRKIAAGAATAAAAGLAAKKLHDHRRHRSRSSSTSSDDSSHKLRNTALLGAAALAARHHHKKKERSRSRSVSRPGILRRRSRTYSPPRSALRRPRSLSRHGHRSHSRHRSSSRGAALAKAAAVTMAGALAKQHHRRKSRSRARSADAAAERRRRHMRGERRVHYHNDPHVYNGGSSASTIHPGSSVSNVDPRGGRIRNAIMPAEGQRARSRRGSMAQDIAYKVGESVAEGLRRI